MFQLLTIYTPRSCDLFFVDKTLSIISLLSVFIEDTLTAPEQFLNNERKFRENSGVEEFTLHTEMKILRSSNNN